MGMKHGCRMPHQKQSNSPYWRHRGAPVKTNSSRQSMSKSCLSGSTTLWKSFPARKSILQPRPCLQLITDNCMTLAVSGRLYQSINIVNFVIDGHIDDKYWDVNLCLSWDSNLTSPVLRTGVLTIRPLRHFYHLRKNLLSHSHFNQRLTKWNTILQF